MPAPWSFGAEVRVVGLIHGSQTVNVYHFATNETIQDNPEPGRELLIQLLSALLACVVETLLPAVSEDWSLTQVDGRLIHPAFSDPIIEIPAGPTPGELGPTNISFAASCVSIRTSVGGKSHRGRKYLPPVGDANMTNSLIDDPALILIGQFLTCVAGKFIGPNPTEFWRLGVLSHKLLKAAGGTFNNSFTQATGLVPRKIVARMASRQLGVGS